MSLFERNIHDTETRHKQYISDMHDTKATVWEKKLNPNP